MGNCDLSKNEKVDVRFEVEALKVPQAKTISITWPSGMEKLSPSIMVLRGGSTVKSTLELPLFRMMVCKSCADILSEVENISKNTKALTRFLAIRLSYNSVSVNSISQK